MPCRFSSPVRDRRRSLMIISVRASSDRKMSSNINRGEREYIALASALVVLQLAKKARQNGRLER